MATTFKPIPPDQYMTNPGYLKLDLMIQGVRVDPSLYKQGIILENYRLSDGVLGNLDLILKDETYVSVPYQEKDVENSPYKLRSLHGKYYLTSGKETVPVKILPHPKFYDQKINSEASFGQVLSCHGSYVSLALGGHRYLQPDLAGGHQKELELSIDETIAVLERVRKDQKLDVVTLSAWSAEGEDGGILQIEPYIRAIKSFFNVLLFIEVHPPQKAEFIDLTYAMGADSVCYHLGNLCNHGNATAKEKSQTELDLKMLRHAVSIFPPGSILSHLTMGNRPMTEVIEDIDDMASIKVLPILTAESREVILERQLTTEQLAPVFGYVYDAAKNQKITMNWFSRLAPFIAPIEGRYFSGDTPRLKLALLNFYQARFLGGSISAGLSNLRRKLRVREVKTKG